MARRRTREQTVFFPWERRRALRFPLLRSRPLIAGLCMAVVLLVLGLRERRHRGIRSTRATLELVGAALDAYRADHEWKCPPSLGILEDEGYLHTAPVDAWGRPLLLSCPGRRHPESYDLISLGPSGDMRTLDRVE
ncbi:MAG: type II secretion system protein GspG [Myxococcales bacterium]|nr:type II secretion system protein GspG [Myxococcales bacterium]